MGRNSLPEFCTGNHHLQISGDEKSDQLLAEVFSCVKVSIEFCRRSSLPFHRKKSNLQKPFQPSLPSENFSKNPNKQTKNVFTNLSSEQGSVIRKDQNDSSDTVQSYQSSYKFTDRISASFFEPVQWESGSVNQRKSGGLSDCELCSLIPSQALCVREPAGEYHWYQIISKQIEWNKLIFMNFFKSVHSDN